MRLSKKELRRQLFDKDPHCYWCGCLTVWWTKPGWKPKDAATLDHIYTRYETKMRQHSNHIVLACSECNAKRGEEATKSQPIEELWRRAGQLDRMAREGRLVLEDANSSR